MKVYAELVHPRTRLPFCSQFYGFLDQCWTLQPLCSALSFSLVQLTLQVPEKKFNPYHHGSTKLWIQTWLWVLTFQLRGKHSSILECEEKSLDYWEFKPSRGFGIDCILCLVSIYAWKESGTLSYSDKLSMFANTNVFAAGHFFRMII